MKPRFGLQARFLALIVVAMLLAIVAVAIMLQRQWIMRQEIIEMSRTSIQSLVLERLREQARAVGLNTADALVNPLYNFDLERIGQIVRDVMAQPDVKYVTIYAPSGAIIHDGSDAIASYGQVMSDALAPAIIHANDLLMQRSDGVFDVAAPISIGDERLGGVRIGYSLDSVKRYEEHSTQLLGERLNEIGRRYLIGVVALMSFALVFGIVISLIMQRVLIRPIRRLALAAREVEAGKLTMDLPERDSGDEVGELVRAFERMTEGIARRDRDIRRIANTDSLTGLANRRAIRDEIEARLADRGSGEFALILADLDDFKPVNDRWGHDAGDKLLCRFAERLREVVNAIEEIEARPARLGGDEFILVARVADGVETPLRDLLTRLGENLMDEFSKPSSIDGRTHLFSASFGIAIFPDDGRTTTQLMKAADVAMYAAKQAGKNRYRFHTPR